MSLLTSPLMSLNQSCEGSLLHLWLLFKVFPHYSLQLTLFTASKKSLDAV